MSAGSSLFELLEGAAGIVVPDADRRRIEEIAHRLAVRRTGGDLERFLRMLRLDPGHDDWQSLLSAITIKESYLFRSPRQFDVLREEILPELVRRRSARRLTLWCAGCARGEEAVTAAMIFAESEALAGWSWRILATDVDRSALDEARAGIYGDRAVAKVPDALRRRYLERRADRYRVVDSLRSRIEYRPLNLVRLPLAVPGAPHDIVMLRNVLIYFRADLQQRVVAGIAGAMAPDGFLFLGPSESLLQLAVPLVPEDRGGCFVYRPGATRSEPRSTGAALRKPDRPAAPGPVPSPPTSRRDGTGTGSGSSPARILGEVVRMLAEGRIGDATERAQETAAARPEDPHARALLGLALLRRGRSADAIRELRASLYLEPSLAHARLLLAEGLTSEGRDDRARRELRTVYATVASGSPRWLEGWRELGLPDADEIVARCRMSMRSDSESG